MQPALAVGAEARLNSLHREAASDPSRLRDEFVDLFEALPGGGAVSRVRALLDGGLVFAPEGSHVDLRRLVFSLPEDDRQRVLARIHNSCEPPVAERQGFVVLADIADTVVSGADDLDLRIGEDRWDAEKELHPGTAQLLKELRGDLRPPHRDYPILLTTQGLRMPPREDGHPPSKGSRARMSILQGDLPAAPPACPSFASAAPSLAKAPCSGGQGCSHQAKLRRMTEYAWLFPDYGGRYVFLGSDACDGDRDAALGMLGFDVPSIEGCGSAEWAESLSPLFAFAAIRAARTNAADFLVSAEERAAFVNKARSLFPAVADLANGSDGSFRHRFFYYETHADLAVQLAEAGWLYAEQRDAVLQACRRGSRSTAERQAAVAKEPEQTVLMSPPVPSAQHCSPALSLSSGHAAPNGRSTPDVSLAGTSKNSSARSPQLCGGDAANCDGRASGEKSADWDSDDLMALRQQLSCLRPGSCASQLLRAEAKVRQLQQAYVLLPPPSARHGQRAVLELCVLRVEFKNYVWTKLEAALSGTMPRVILRDGGSPDEQLREAGSSGIFPLLSGGFGVCSGARGILDVSVKGRGSGRCFVTIDSSLGTETDESTQTSVHNASLFEISPRLDASALAVGEITLSARWRLVDATGEMRPAVALPHMPVAEPPSQPFAAAHLRAGLTCSAQACADGGTVDIQVARSRKNGHVPLSGTLGHWSESNSASPHEDHYGICDAQSPLSLVVCPPQAQLLLPPAPDGCEHLTLQVLRVVRNGRRFWSTVDLTKPPLPYAALYEEANSNAEGYWFNGVHRASLDGSFPLLDFSESLRSTGSPRRFVLDIGTCASDVCRCLVVVPEGTSTSENRTSLLTAMLVEGTGESSARSSGNEVMISARWHAAHDTVCKPQSVAPWPSSCGQRTATSPTVAAHMSDGNSCLEGSADPHHTPHSFVGLHSPDVASPVAFASLGLCAGTPQPSPSWPAQTQVPVGSPRSASGASCRAWHGCTGTASPTPPFSDAFSEAGTRTGQVKSAPNCDSRSPLLTADEIASKMPQTQRNGDRGRVRINPEGVERIYLTDKVNLEDEGEHTGVSEYSFSSGNGLTALTEDKHYTRVCEELSRGASKIHDSEEICAAIQRARDIVNAQHTALTTIWRSPLCLFDSRAEEQALALGVPPGAVDDVLCAKDAVDEAAVLIDLAEVYQAQVAAAKRDGRRIARTHLVELLSRLDDLVERLRVTSEALLKARVAFDAPVESSTLAVYGAQASKGLLRNVQRPNHELDLPVSILEPHRRLLPVARYSIQALETCIDLVEQISKRVRVTQAVEQARRSPVVQLSPIDWQELWNQLGLDRLAARVQRSRWWSVVWETIGSKANGALPRSSFPTFSGSSASPLSMEAVPSSAAPVPRLTIGYWNFRGLGAPLRMMCAYAGLQDYEDVKYEVWPRARGKGWIAPEWERRHKPELKEQNPFVQLPYVLNHLNGEVVAGSCAAYLYLGRLLNLLGTSMREQSENEQVLFYVHGMQMEFGDLCYPFKNNKDEQSFQDSLVGHFGQALPSHYDKLETWLRQRHHGAGSWPPHFASTAPCCADFVAWEVIDQNEALAQVHGFESPLSVFETLKAHYDRLRTLPRLRGYFESYDATLPINNKMAFFK